MNPIYESLMKEMLPGEAYSLVNSAITLLGGESKRVAAGLKAISRRHGSNIGLGYKRLADLEGVYVVYSRYGEWSRRQVELQWPTIGTEAIMFVTSKKDPYGKAYRYVIPKKIVAPYFRCAVDNYGEKVHIKWKLYDDSFVIDDTFRDYPTYDVDPRTEEEITKYGCSQFEPTVFYSQDECYLQSDYPYFLDCDKLYDETFMSGQVIDTLDGFEGFFYIRSGDNRSPYYYSWGKHITISEIFEPLPGNHGLEIHVEPGEGAEIIAVDFRALKAWRRKIEAIRRRIAAQPHAKLDGLLQWEVIAFGPKGLLPHGFGNYVDKWIKREAA